tara:strand:+ start:25405 stop:26577 length:1173 start_codon:yes stop_codon:yes gene_type:complete
MSKRIVLFGATGSIGESTLKVLRKHPDRLELVGVASNTRYTELSAIAEEFKVPQVCLFDEHAYTQAKTEGYFPQATLSQGFEGLEALATLPEADLVVMAMDGTNGIRPTLAALNAGKEVALASKEVLVLAGEFVMEAARKNNTKLLPLDSEHNAIFQCLEGHPTQQVDKVILTASGGPFRDYTWEQMHSVTPQQALKHPNWDMGPKNTLDSATMANKGLELIEAHWLFGTPANKLEVLVNPTSAVHGLVTFVDGSILAHLSPASMTFPIQNSLLYPDRAASVYPTFDFSQGMSIELYPPDLTRFPCLKLAMEALEAGGIAPTLFNAANEVAVKAFVDTNIAFTDIPKIIEKTLDTMPNSDPSSIEALLEINQEALALASTFITPTPIPTA